MIPPAIGRSRRFLVATVITAMGTLIAMTASAQDASPVASPGTSASSPSAMPVTGRVTLYTSVTQDTIDAVLATLGSTHPDLEVEVFRAPTGELDARIASELRSGGIGADVLWLSDPLSMQQYDAQGLLAPLEGEAFEAVPAEYRSGSFVGTRLLNLVIAAQPDLEPMPTSWADLAAAALAGSVAIPDPGFAGSAFAALGYFALAEGYGVDYYEQLAANGAINVASPVDIVSGVAEGRYAAGITLDKLVRDAIAAGSPLELVWPEPGAIAVYSPAAVTTASDDAEAATRFVGFLVSPEAQTAIAASGWQPVLPGIDWPSGGPVVTPDWDAAFGSQQELLEAYRSIFGD